MTKIDKFGCSDYIAFKKYGDLLKSLINVQMNKRKKEIY